MVLWHTSKRFLQFQSVKAVLVLLAMACSTEEESADVEWPAVDIEVTWRDGSGGEHSRTLSEVSLESLGSARHYSRHACFLKCCSLIMFTHWVWHPMSCIAESNTLFLALSHIATPQLMLQLTNLQFVLERTCQ